MFLSYSSRFLRLCDIRFPALFLRISMVFVCLCMIPPMVWYVVLCVHSVWFTSCYHVSVYALWLVLWCSWVIAYALIRSYDYLEIVAYYFVLLCVHTCPAMLSVEYIMFRTVLNMLQKYIRLLEISFSWASAGDMGFTDEHTHTQYLSLSLSHIHTLTHTHTHAERERSTSEKTEDNAVDPKTVYTNIVQWIAS